MTRPGFVAITLVACSLGFSLAYASGATISMPLALMVTVVAVLMHAAANVLNDYHDACNGADGANTQGLFPFTGGARLIQNGEVTAAQTLRLAHALAVVALLLGLIVVWIAGVVVMPLGLAGAVLGWAYSAPPLRLMTRGAGELTVGCVWALIVLGSDVVFRGAWDTSVWWAALGYGACIANVLLINAYPDATADAQVGKRTAVVRLGPQRAAVLYVMLCLSAYGALVGGVWTNALPSYAFGALLGLPTTVVACVGLWRHAHAPQKLRLAIVCTISTAVHYGLGLSVGCVWGA